MTDTKKPIYPADQLLAFLEKNKSDPMDETTIRIPIYVTLSANKMEIQTSKVGDKADALAIKVDDRTLNIPIVGKLPMFFGEGADKGMIWVHGVWRGGQDKEFQVTRVEGKIDEGARASANFAEIMK